MPLIDATKNKKKKAGSSSSVTPTASTPSITYEKLTALSGQGDKVASALLASGRYKPSVGMGGQDGGEWGVLNDSEAIKAGLPTTGFESTIPKGNGGVYPQNLRQAMGGRAGRVAGVNPVSVAQMGRKGMASTLGRTANSAGAYYGSAGTDTSSTSVYDGRGVDRSMGVGGNGGLYDDLMSYLSPDSVIDRQKKIRQELERSRQSQLDAIKQKYSSQMDQRQQQGQEDLARMRSMNLRAGLGGSDFGAANKEQVREGVRKDFRMMEANRDVEIGNVINEIDQLAQQQFQIEQNAMRQNFSTAIEYQKYVQGQQQIQRKEMVDRVAALGKAGLDIASIKERDPQLYKNLTASSGMSDVELEAVLNNNKPAPAKIDYQTIVRGGKIMMFGVDPATNQLKMIEQEVDMPDNYKTLQADDGTILGIPENWDGDTSKIVTVGNYRKPLASEIGGGAEYSADPTVESWANLIQTGNATLANVPANLKTRVAQALSSNVQNGTDPVKIERAQNLMNAITQIENLGDGVLGNAVGPISSKIMTLRGSTSDFESYFNNLKSLLTLDNLGLMKGVLSDKDIEILKNAGTALNLGMSEKTFKQELQKIKEKVSATLSQSQNGNIVTAPDGTIIELID